MQIIERSQALRECVRAWRAQGQRVALAPTMGNLHAGHAELIKRARQFADRVIVSLFVNPMQFGPNEDYAAYPRTPNEDQALLRELRVDALFMPTVADMYPAGHAQSTFVEAPELDKTLCGAFRPGHFRGVATVVVKLLNLAAPDVAVFGEKDFQQLAVIKRAVADLCMPIEIVGVPTVREADGLAMSSRNRYLTAQERAVAPQIYGALQSAWLRLQSGARDYGDIEHAGRQALTDAGFGVDYFSVCDALTLQSPTAATREWLVATAARLGKARLIDNVRFSAN